MKLDSFVGERVQDQGAINSVNFPARIYS